MRKIYLLALISLIGISVIAQNNQTKQTLNISDSDIEPMYVNAEHISMPANHSTYSSASKSISISGDGFIGCDSSSTILRATGCPNYAWSKNENMIPVISMVDSLETGILKQNTTYYLETKTSSEKTLCELPAHMSSYTGNVRGYYFVAPIDFLITGLRVPTDASTEAQNIAILRFNTAPPEWSGITSDFEELGYWANYSLTDTINVSIPIYKGDTIGIYGNRNNNSSYAAGGPTTTNIGDTPVTLIRSGMQAYLDSEPMHDVWSEADGNISRVEFFYDLNPISEKQNINVAIGHSSSSIITEIACGDSYTAPDGNIYTEPGNYTAIVENASGCDSTISINLSFHYINSSVTTNNQSLTADSEGCSYQWLNCNNNYEAISNAISQTFTATTNGEYAVEITEYECVDTSTCHTISSVGIENFIFNDVRLYPNPTQGIVNINFGNLNHPSIKVYNIQGKLILEQNNINKSNLEFNLKEAPGIYILEIISGDEKKMYKLLKK